MLAGLACCEMLSQYPRSAFQGLCGGRERGPAAVCDANPPRSGEARGPRLVGGTRLVVFPRPNRPQFERATSRDPLSSRDPLPLALPKEVQKGGRGPGRRGGVPARRGVGVPARGILRPIRCQAAWEYHEPGPPNEPGPLAFSHTSICSV